MREIEYILKFAELADSAERLAKRAKAESNKLAAAWGGANGFYALNVEGLRRLEAARAAREASHA